ncbi:MAG TPA: hypothetical protein VMT24_08375 [Aggregatilineaceae bacterium]|nr:hypothetical protein [Aggregatilineaceae bacterium]
MRLRFITAGVVLFAVCLGAVTGARAAGRLIPETATYLDSGPCEQPCWHGLRPGRDYVDHFLYQVRAASPYTSHTSDAGDGIVTMFELSTYGAITVADVLREFGSPERVGCLGLEHTTLYPGHTLAMAVQLYFAQGLVVVDALRPDESPRLTPDMRVRSIRYYAPGEPAYPIGMTTPWHGFTSTRAFYLSCH